MEAEDAVSSTQKMTRSEMESTQIRKSPLCVFALSPPFQPVLATSRRPKLDKRRSLPKVRPRFKKRRSEVPLLHYLKGGERHDGRRRQSLNVEGVLSTIRQVWKTSHEQSLSSPAYEVKMDGGSRFRKISYSSSDNPSPMLLRRRLSAPEIVMRKHTLAQQRSDSQDSEETQASDVKSCQFRNEFSVGSDSSLNRKRDSSFMRKSTLLRRLWSNSKPPTETSMRTSSCRSIQSLGSAKSSPRTSPKHNILSRMELSLSPRRLQNSNTMTTTETDFETTTASLDNSDSAFSNSRSHFTESTSSDMQKVIGLSQTYNEDENKNQTSARTSEDHLLKNSQTQTLGTTNVNVISNVQLSKTTLDIIYNQVLKDVKDAVPDVININTLTVTPEPRRINVQQVPSFYLKTNEEVALNPKHDQMLKYMMSNVGTGSSYSKPTELPQIAVPRFSAYPRTTSMEVNTSSAESTDRESDTISLVDSLDDPSPTHTELSVNRHDDKPVRGSISSLLPDNSDTKKHKSENKAFFIPIETDVELLEKAVSEHLPEKVRERLSRRQMELKSKATSPRSDSNYVSSSDSHRFHILVGSSSGNDGGNVKQKKRSKPFLPSIQTTRKIRIDSRDSARSRRATRKQAAYSNSSSKAKPQARIPKLSPLFSTNNEYHYDAIPNRIYHKTELNNLNKRIEILEIMECIDVTPERYAQHAKGKSKIPVLVNPRLPRLNQQKPAFLEVQQVRIEDPKVDQLIANILIDTLNKVEDPDDDISKASLESKAPKDEKKPTKFCYGNKYQQKFEVIPEELLQSSTESNNNEAIGKVETVASKHNEEETKSDLYKGKAALAVVKDDNLTTIPQGWITFYMLQKSQGSPDSTSDEGKATNENDKIKDEEKKFDDGPPVRVERKETSDSFDRSSCTDVHKSAKTLPQIHTKYKRKTRNRNSINHAPSNQPEQRGWSVTVSGSNSCGNFTPNLEMKLNFPQSTQQNVATSDVRHEEEQTHRTERSNCDISDNTFEASSNENDKSVIYSHRCKLPNINKERSHTKTGQRCESTILNEPRHTKTSSTRISLNRPRPLPLLSSNLNFDNSSDLNLEERQLEEFLRRFPHFLSVTGNAIYQDRRPRIYTVTENDLVSYTKRN